MKTLKYGMALLAAAAMAGLVTAGLAMAGGSAASAGEWQPDHAGIVQFSYSRVPLPLLPRRHQNHCGMVNGHYVCADHCGIDYQVYYCPTSASGCCHVGLGYCDEGGRLRCAPTWFDALLKP
jgi:hypothetical protein